MLKGVIAVVHAAGILLDSFALVPMSSQGRGFWAGSAEILFVTTTVPS
jgi:hypothetical protein